jgi:hypothetical protein
MKDKVWTVTVGTVTGVFVYAQAAHGILSDAPHEAVGSLAVGASSTSSVSVNTAGVVYMADTVMDKVYPVWFGQLPTANATGIAPDGFSLTPRSS